MVPEVPADRDLVVEDAATGFCGAVVGFDDVPIAALMRPALTTMRVNIAEIGRRGVERLIGLVQVGATADATDTACEIVRPILVERQSTAAASSARFNKG